MQRLVVCADGTWKSRDGSGDATNVEELCDAVPPVAADGTRQPALHLAGVGTGRLERLRGGAFGMGLSRNVQECYRSVYRLQRPLVREIGAPPVTVGGRTLRTHERVHPSNVERHRRLTSPPRGPYAPANLVAHLSPAWPEQRDGAHERTPAPRDAPSTG